MELLSPAKNLEIGISAINCGADAVYIGASDFGARKMAANSVQDIEKLVNYAHFYGAKVYVTFNTILYDSELQAAEKLIRSLYNVGVDALIVQDLGILQMDIPPIELHASTQMNNYDLRRIKFFDDLGFKRIVLARECSLHEIEKIRNSIKAEIECFVHGALCVSFSGQCYMSAKIGGRSANRGECAQACRLKYSLENSENKVLVDDSYLLSLKDFATYDKISEMLRIGVNSLKIEGRLKDISYVSNVTAYYRKLIDSILESQGKTKISSGKSYFDFEPDLRKVFNRGFTDYFMSEKPKKMANFVSPKSMGEPLGVLSSKKANSLIINTDKQISNGDGMCYIKNGQLFGFRVEKVDGKIVFAKTENNLTVGTEIFRNLDTQFQKKIDHSRTLRKVGVNVKCSLKPDDFFVEFVDEDGISCKSEIPFEFQAAKDSQKSLNNFRDNLAKMGESFELVSFDANYSDGSVPFVPNSVVSELRRTLIENLKQMRLKHFASKDSPLPSNDVMYFDSEGNYRLNVSNKLAKQFYENHGCKVSQAAFELLPNTSGLEVMTTKYCIRREMGFCVKENKNVPKEWKSDVFLLKGPYENFRLKFDCKDCCMRIFAK